VLLCFIDPRVRNFQNETTSCSGIFFRTLRFYYVASTPSSPLLHLLDRHKDTAGCSAIPASSCPGPVRYPWRRIVELEVHPDETPGLMTLHHHTINVLQSITDPTEKERMMLNYVEIFCLLGSALSAENCYGRFTSKLSGDPILCPAEPIFCRGRQDNGRCHR